MLRSIDKKIWKFCFTISVEELAGMISSRTTFADIVSKRAVERMVKLVTKTSVSVRNQKRRDGYLKTYRMRSQENKKSKILKTLWKAPKYKVQVLKKKSFLIKKLRFLKIQTISRKTHIKEKHAKSTWISWLHKSYYIRKWVEILKNHEQADCLFISKFIKRKRKRI